MALDNQIQNIRARMRDIEARKPDGWSQDSDRLQEILGALTLIKTLRRRLAIQLRQVETAGAAPRAYLESEIQDARDQIRAQKDRALNLGFVVEAEVQDDAPETAPHMDVLMAEIMAAAERARSEPRYTSLHEAYTQIARQIQVFFDAGRTHLPGRGDVLVIRAEAVRIAALTIKAVEDLRLESE